MKKILISTLIFALFSLTLSSVVAAPGEGGYHADENAAVESQGDQSLLDPSPATNKRIIKKVLPTEDTKGKDTTPPGQGGTPPGQEEDDGDDSDSDDGDSEDTESGLTGVLGEEVTGDKYAIVIGICNYPGEDYDICWSDGDSVNMHDALTKHYGFTEENVILLKDMYELSEEPIYNPDGIVDGAATVGNIDAAISYVDDRVEPDDEVVFFFSGHGGEAELEDGSKAESIIAHDGTTTKHILDKDLRDRFSAIGATTSRISFVFDSCLAGGMDDVAADGRVVSMATDDKQPASVYSTGSEEENEPGEGVFSHYFVNEGMLDGYADTVDHDEDNETGESDDVVVEEAFKYANDNISGRQKPTLDDRFTNDLLW
jgi:hypothetical protein